MRISLHSCLARRDARASYFSQFRRCNESLRLNIFSICAIFERRGSWHSTITTGCEAKRIWAIRARISVGEQIERTPRETRPYIHWQLTSTSTRIIEISTRVVGKIGRQEIIFRMFSYKRRALAMAILVHEKSVTFTIPLRKNVLKR